MKQPDLFPRSRKPEPPRRGPVSIEPFDFEATADEWANVPGGPIPDDLRIPMIDDEE